MSLKNKVLQRQLAKLGLNPNSLPESLESWQSFLSRVDSHYSDSEEDRYLMERSLEISSLEMRERFTKISLLVDQLKLNQGVLQDLLNDAPFEAVMSNLASNLEGRVSGFQCAIFQGDIEGNALRLAAAPSFPRPIQRAMAKIEAGPDTCPCGQAAHLKNPVIYSGETSHPRHEQLCAMGVRSCYAYPVLNPNREVVAVFSLFADQNKSLTQEQSELMAGLGEIMQMALNYAEIKRALKKEQEAAAARSKMTTLGEMAGGVAHEINNPLFILQGYVDLINASIEDKTIDEDELKETCNSMSAAIHRVARIVRTLRNFSRDASGDPLEATDVEVLLSDALELCSKRYEGVRIDLAYSDSGLDARVMCRPVELVQVLINLLNNSYDAVRGLPNPWIRIEVVQAKGRIEIKVTDSGKGIAEKAKAKLFHPFVTTKPAGQGTGLGLSISKKIVESHSGKIIYNPKNENTQFIVDLPVYKEAV